MSRNPYSDLPNVVLLVFYFQNSTIVVSMLGGLGFIEEGPCKFGLRIFQSVFLIVSFLSRTSPLSFFQVMTALLFNIVRSLFSLVALQGDLTSSQAQNLVQFSTSA